MKNVESTLKSCQFVLHKYYNFATKFITIMFYSDFENTSIYFITRQRFALKKKNYLNKKIITMEHYTFATWYLNRIPDTDLFLPPCSYIHEGKWIFSELHGPDRDSG